MDCQSGTWENLTSKKNETFKSYPINSSDTTISHLYAHEILVGGSSKEYQSYVTVATYSRDFVLLENRGFGQLYQDVEFKEVLKVRTDYPILHCVLDYNYDTHHSKYVLVGYLIDIFATTYTLNLSKAIDLAQRFPNNPHPVQFTILAQACKNSNFNEEEIYLETPLMLKKIDESIISVNLRGEIMLLDMSQSISWLKSYEMSYQKESLKNVALAAAHNRISCQKYKNVIVIATHNGRAPYVFVNCSTVTDFENQKQSQDRYEWIQDSIEITNCAIDPATSLVCVSTVAQTTDIYQIAQNKDSRGPFYYLRKKFGFFISNNLHFTDFKRDSNIESLHASNGLLLITSSREHIIYDLVQQCIRKRAKGNQICMLKWGHIIDRREKFVAVMIAKGYNHINKQQSKIGKPNIHFKSIQLKQDK